MMLTNTLLRTTLMRGLRTNNTNGTTILNQTRAFGAYGTYLRHWKKDMDVKKDPKRVVRPFIGSDHLWVPSKPWNYPTGRLDPYNPAAACSVQGGGNEGVPPEYVDIFRTQQQITPLELGWVSYAGLIAPGLFLLSLEIILGSSLDNGSMWPWLLGF